MAEGLASMITAGGALLGNIWNAYEARQNRNFQERMSNTAHQREMADLKAANINPMFRGMGGAPSPAGDRAEMKDVSSGLRARAELKLLEAQTERENATARLGRVQAADIENTFSTGRGRSIAAAADFAEMTNRQMQEMFPELLKKAQEEIKLASSSARAAGASADLDAAALKGAKALEDFYERVGEYGPWGRALLDLVRAMGVLRR